MQKAIIIGATSGIGQEVARILVQQGWHIGIAGRRKEALHALQATAPDRIVTEQLDVTEETATLHLHNLIKSWEAWTCFSSVPAWDIKTGTYNRTSN